MEKIMSKFKIDKDIKKGKSIQNVNCKHCSESQEISIINKLNRKKITTFRCKKCNRITTIGDIYNFDTGKLLNDPLDNRFDSQKYDEYEWSQDYDNIGE